MEIDINLLTVRIYEQLKHSKLSSFFPHFLQSQMQTQVTRNTSCLSCGILFSC